MVATIHNGDQSQPEQQDRLVRKGLSRFLISPAINIGQAQPSLPGSLKMFALTTDFLHSPVLAYDSLLSQSWK